MSTDLRHEPSCTSTQTRRVRGRHGDLLERCRECRGYRVVSDDEPDDRSPGAPRPREDDTPPTPRPVLVSAYRCREHGRPVTFRGTGCPECDAPRRRGRRRRMPAERPADDWPEWDTAS